MKGLRYVYKVTCLRGWVQIGRWIPQDTHDKYDYLGIRKKNIQSILFLCYRKVLKVKCHLFSGEKLKNVSVLLLTLGMLWTRNENLRTVTELLILASPYKKTQKPGILFTSCKPRLGRF